MIDGEVSHMKMLVKIHLEDMKRIVTRYQSYFFSALNNTPFSFAIVMPDGYGMHEIHAQTNLSGYRSNNISLAYRQNVLELFDTDWRWVIHPEWIYCRHLYSNPDRTERTREANLYYFLTQIPFKNLSWGNHQRVKDPPQRSEYMYDKAIKMNRDEVYCDHELIESLLFDANATKNHERPVTNMEKRTSAARMYGVTVSFVATRSGLTRWTDFEEEGKLFGRYNNKSIDELWYKRAVDYHIVDNKSFVFSVPFNVKSNDTLVTATYAIFIGGHRKAPVAVVGLQFKHSYLVKFFNGVTKMNCSRADVECYLLDNNGFVILDEKSEQIGKFYGEVDRNIMDTLVKGQIYRRIHMVDYQAVCLDTLTSSDSATMLLTPFNHLKIAFSWLWYKALSFYIEYSFFNMWNYVTGSPSYDMEENYSDRQSLPKKLEKKRPRPCDKEFYLYELNQKKFAETVPQSGRLLDCNAGCNKSYALQLVPHTNLVLLVVEDDCKCESSKISSEQTEVIYNKTQMCNWLKSNIYRRRPRQCVNYHPKELDIRDCGRGALTHLPSMIVIVVMVVISILNRHSY